MGCHAGLVLAHRPGNHCGGAIVRPSHGITGTMPWYEGTKQMCLGPMVHRAMVHCAMVHHAMVHHGTTMPVTTWPI